jgi:hypothetical protein
VEGSYTQEPEVRGRDLAEQRIEGRAILDARYWILEKNGKTEGWNDGRLGKTRIQKTGDPSGVELQNHSTGQAGDRMKPRTETPE